MKLFCEKLKQELERQIDACRLADDTASHYGVSALKAMVASLDSLIQEEEMAAQSSFKKIVWTGPKIALAELIYALHTEGIFNHGSVSLQDITHFFETTFDIDVGRLSIKYIELRARKIERTKFLNGLAERLVVRMDNADDGIYTN